MFIWGFCWYSARVYLNVFCERRSKLMPCVPVSCPHGYVIMSDRGIPRSYRMMQNFGVNTYTLINAEG